MCGGGPMRDSCEEGQRLKVPALFLRPSSFPYAWDRVARGAGTCHSALLIFDALSVMATRRFHPEQIQPS